ncbi:Tim10/DDP family zinc finger-domain-containing protein [Limtongia smithiae]|uniref:Tim10/DDP family zinc finger-domain-containing protein n=1 Tax=Limtongia smithiae TaxID=1125753 RepID=UPI0034CF404D
MSFFGMGARPMTDYDENKINAIKGEMLMMSQMKEKVSNACFEKCLPGYYTESDLNKGESNCVDRCTAKFFQTIKLLGTEMQKQQQAAGGL